MMYGAETWTMKKVYEKRLEVTEMRMLRSNEVDRIRNEVIKNRIKVKEVSSRRGDYSSMAMLKEEMRAI
jgi:hypothetical protein